MIKDLIKNLNVIIIIFLIINPIVLSNSNKIENHNNITLTFYEQTTKGIDDQKIVQAIEMVNESLLREYLEVLVSNGPRKTGTYGCEMAAEYIYNQFKEIGLETRYQRRLQNLSFVSN